jgi:hypothetical protein
LPAALNWKESEILLVKDSFPQIVFTPLVPLMLLLKWNRFIKIKNKYRYSSRISFCWLFKRNNLQGFRKVVKRKNYEKWIYFLDNNFLTLLAKRIEYTVLSFMSVCALSLLKLGNYKHILYCWKWSSLLYI